MLSLSVATFRERWRLFVGASFADLHGRAVAVAGGDLGATVRIRVGRRRHGVAAARVHGGRLDRGERQCAGEPQRRDHEGADGPGRALRGDRRGERRREFAVARLMGLSREQVVGSALLESAVVTVTGLLFGWLAALATLVGISGGSGTLMVPWGVFWPTVLGAFVVVGAASVWTGLAATRPTPISPAGARE